MNERHLYSLNNLTPQPENANEFFPYKLKSRSEERIAEADEYFEKWLKIRFGDLDTIRFEEMKKKTKVNVEIEYVNIFGGVQNSSVWSGPGIRVRGSLLGKGTRYSLIIILSSLPFLVNNPLVGLAGLFFGFAGIFAVNVASWIETGDQYFSVYMSVLGFFAMTVLTIMSIVGIFNY